MALFSKSVWNKMDNASLQSIDSSLYVDKKVKAML